MQAEQMSQAGSYAGAGGAVILWGLDATEIAVLSSALFAGLSFLVHLWVSWRRDRREQAEHDAKLGG